MKWFINLRNVTRPSYCYCYIEFNLENDPFTPKFTFTWYFMVQLGIPRFGLITNLKLQ